MSTSTPRGRRRHNRFAGLLDAAVALQPHTVSLRRAVHREPEQGLLLPKTQAAVQKALSGLPITLHAGTTVSSVVGVVDGDRDGPTVLLRADMDALPLTEESGVPFSSRIEGSMHACGHDAHVAMLVSAARLLAENRGELAGRVVFMFQPGEEGHHGARYMLDEGLLDVAGPLDRALALHVTATLDSGVVQSRPGPIMGSSDILRVTVTGRGGHASAPHNAVDPIPAAAAMVGALQTMVTRSLTVFDPAVVTVSRIVAGTTSNIIPEHAHLEGTIRALSELTRTRVHEELRRVCRHVAAAHGCTAEIDIEHGYPVTISDSDVGAEMPDPMMGAEDFSYVLARVPGAMAFLGACPPGVDTDHAPANHSNRVVFDEAALAHGVAMYTAFALDAMGAR